MKKNWIYIVVALIIQATVADGQQVLLSKVVSGDVFNRQVGPNLKHYYAWTINVNSVLSVGEALPTQDYNGLGWNYGFRYKRKLASRYAMVFDLYYFNQRYRLDTLEILNDYALNADEEHLRYSGLGFSFTNRIGLSKTGNRLGYYFDFGGYVKWGFSRKHLLVYNNEDKSTTELWYSKLDYIEPFTYGLTAAIGLNSYRIYAQYRIGKLIKDFDYGFDLPLLLVGVQLDMNAVPATGL